MQTYNPQKSDITSDSTNIKEDDCQISEQEQNEIRDLIVAVRSREIKDRDQQKLIDYCEHLVSHTHSLQNNMMSLKMRIMSKKVNY